MNVNESILLETESRRRELQKRATRLTDALMLSMSIGHGGSLALFVGSEKANNRDAIQGWVLRQLPELAECSDMHALQILRRRLADLLDTGRDPTL
ncbi:MAG: hypothetical protein KDG50_13895 [Chromatiales bacterium]|nr:hypothetical protein [Chromatiales bacterium]